MTDDAAPPARVAATPAKLPNYTAVFAAELIELARTDRRIVGITAGMPTGTGMSKFQAEFPDRMFDVGIAEQHSMAMATGLAMGGMRPVVALYSTFLQRAFDQTVHDVCQNDQPVHHRGRPGRARRRGWDEPPGDVHAAGPAPDPEPGRRLAQGRAGIAVSAAFGFGPGPSVRPPLPARQRVRAGARDAVGDPGRAGRDVARGPRSAVRRLRADRHARARGGLGAGGRGLVGGRHQRPLCAATRPSADPRPGPRQADGRDLRGERRDRRLRERHPGAGRGGPLGRSGLS